MDLEIDEFSGCLLLFEPGAESNQRYMVDDDVLSAYSVGFIFADEVGGVEMVGEITRDRNTM